MIHKYTEKNQCCEGFKKINSNADSDLPLSSWPLLISSLVSPAWNKSNIAKDKIFLSFSEDVSYMLNLVNGNRLKYDMHVLGNS